MIGINKEKIALGLAWLALSAINTGFVQADMVHRFDYKLDKSEIERYSCLYYRGNLGLAVAVSLLPITWIITPFVTGFYEHGWEIERPKYCEAYAK